MQQPGSEEPRPKRRKIQLACNKCRNRKTRCDGRRPACVACEERGIEAECIYEINTTGSSVQRSSNITNRQKQLSDSTVSRAVLGPTASRNYSVPDDNSDSVGRGTLPSQNGTPVTVEYLGRRPSRTSRGMTDYDRVDGLATVGFPSEDENIYGESSTIAFVRHVMHEQPPPEPHYKSPAMEATREIDESLAVYPRRQTADNYVSSFWEFVHPVFPTLHRDSFMSRYNDVWSSEPSKEQDDADQGDEVVFSATLNMIFALGCQFSSLVAVDRRVLVADEFYQRSRRLFIYDILDTSSLSVLQMLLLTGVYLQSTKYAERCWNTVGLAIRAAQTLGLHSESPARREGQLSREIRRRVWHVCVTLDRLLAMTFGRPAMITRSWDIPFPLVIDDEFLRVDGEGVQPPNLPSQMGLFVYSSRLYDTLDKILITFYTKLEVETTVSVSKDDSLQELLSNVLTFNRQLDSFNSSIPEYLRLPAPVIAPSDQVQNSNVQLQAQILTCRFLYTRVILLRPLLLLSAQGDFQSEVGKPNPWNMATLDKELADYACNLCVKSALQLIENLRHNINTPYRISPWHTVYLSFAAAIVLIAAQRCPVIDPGSKYDAIDIALRKCVEILAHHQPQIHSASQAIRVLQKLRSEVNNTRTQFVVENGISKENPPNPSAGFNGLHTTGAGNLASIEPSQEWWNEVILNGTGTELNSETWFSQHLIDLDWLDIS